MLELETEGSDLRNTRSIAFQYILQYFAEMEKQISSAVDSGSLTNDQLDFVIFIFDLFQKLSRLHYTSNTVRNLLMHYGFSDSCCISAHTNDPATIGSGASTTKWKLTDKNEDEGQQQLAILCDTCEEDVPIINGNLEYSWQLHFRSPYHLEVVSVHRKIQESVTTVKFDSTSPSTNSSTTNITPSQASSSASNNDPFRRSDNLLNPLRIDDALREGSSQTHADVRRNLKIDQTTKPPGIVFSNSISKTEASFQRAEWIQRTKQNSFFKWNGSSYFCKLCDARLPTVHNFDVHVWSYAHRTNLALKRKETASVKTSRSESDVIFSMNGKLYCNLCNISLPSPTNFQAHTSSVAHHKRLMSYLRSTNLSINLKNAPTPIRTAGSLDFVTFYSGKRYCSLCNVQLPGKSQFDGHMNGSLHKSQVELHGGIK